MSFDNPEFDLLAAFKQRFGLTEPAADAPPDTKVLSSAKHVYNNAIDVFIDRVGVQSAASALISHVRDKPFSTASWSEHELHPKLDEFGQEATADFIFTMDLLNFSFWSDRENEAERYCVKYKDKTYTGYWSMVASLRRALDEEIPITSSDFWQCEDDCNEELMRLVFRSETSEEIPLLSERLECLREAGDVLYKKFECNFANIVKKADKSAARLVNLLASNFKCFRDETRWEDEKVRFLKRAQILVADLWACFQGQGLGEFHDIDTITAFADYRIPQMLYNLGCISFSPPLDNRIRQKMPIEPGHSWEIQLRGCSVWTVELLKREMLSKAAAETDAQMQFDESGTQPANRSNLENVNAILLDYHLYDTAKVREAEGTEVIPHHRTRSIWY